MKRAYDGRVVSRVLEENETELLRDILDEWLHIKEETLLEASNYGMSPEEVNSLEQKVEKTKKVLKERLGEKPKKQPVVMRRNTGWEKVVKIDENYPEYRAFGGYTSDGYIHELVFKPSNFKCPYRDIPVWEEDTQEEE